MCRGFKSLQKIDPRFLDPRAVFAELAAPTPNNEAKVFNPEKKKRRREGYDDGDYTQFKEAPASDFIHTSDPIAVLGSLNKLTFEQMNNGNIALAALDRLPQTTEEIRNCCNDLKVLGRKEFRLLLRWRLKVREIFGLASKKKSTENEAQEVVEVVPMDEDLQMEEEIQSLNEKEAAKKRRERRKENERKQKEIVRLQMGMQAPTDIGLEQLGLEGRDSIFSLVTMSQAKNAPAQANHERSLGQSELEESSSSDEEYESEDDADNLDRELDVLYEEYNERKSQADAKFRAKRARQEHDDDAWSGFTSEQEDASDSGSQDETETGDSEDEVLHLRELPNSVDSSGLTRRASSFFDKDIFKNIEGLEERSDIIVQIPLPVVSASTPQNSNSSTLKKLERKEKIEKTTNESTSRSVRKEAAYHKSDDELPSSNDYEDTNKRSDLRPDGRLS